jgi:hypothetical protein
VLQTPGRSFDSFRSCGFHKRPKKIAVDMARKMNSNKPMYPNIMSKKTKSETNKIQKKINYSDKKGETKKPYT